VADTFLLEIATPEKLLVHEQVTEAQIPALDGYLGILPEHAALLSEMGTGELSYMMGGQKHTVAVSGGWLEIVANHARVLTTTVEPAK
jgi:F-type H+-transporting ATPase subunit epsilon